MAQLLKQSTAYTFRLGPFLDSTDGNTQENALTIAYTDVLLSKAGGALAAKSDTTALTGTGANAHYTCVLNTTDTGTLGTLRVWCHVTGALTVWQDFMVVPANIYDSLVAGSDALQVDTIQVSGTTQTANDVGADVDAILVDTAAIDPKIIGTLATGTHNPQSGDSYVRLGAPAGASIAADLVAIEAQTDDIGAAGAGLTALGDTRLANLDATISSRLAPAGTVAACTLVNGLAANVITAASLAADAGTEIAAAVWAKAGAITSLSVELLLERLYEMVNNKMIITEATGAVALRNIADSADVATGNVQDLGATTVRAGLTWV